MGIAYSRRKTYQNVMLLLGNLDNVLVLGAIMSSVCCDKKCKALPGAESQTWRAGDYVCSFCSITVNYMSFGFAAILPATMYLLIAQKYQQTDR